MKRLIALCLLSAGAAALSAAPASQNGKKAAAQSSKVTPAQAAVPAKPVVPEKKQPFELWMTAQNKALECIEKKQYEEALKFFDQAEQEANRGTWKNYTLYEKANLLVKMGRSADALELLREKVSRDRNTSYHRARTALMRGNILTDTGKYDEAAEELKSVVQFNMNNWVAADALLSLGRICELKNDFAGASKYYREVAGDEKFLPGIRSRGVEAEVKMLEKRKEYSQALVYLDAHGTIDQLPADRVLDLAFLRSDLQIALKDLPGARATLDKAMALPGKPGPWHAALFTRKAKVAHLEKRYQESLNLMRRARAVRGHEWGYDKEFHQLIDRLVARQNRERVLRERKARLEKERRAKLERERRISLDRERRRLEKQRNAKKNAEKNK